MSRMRYFTKVEFYNYRADSGGEKAGYYALIFFVYNALIIYLFGLLMYKTDFLERAGLHFSNEHLLKLAIYSSIFILELAPLLFLLRSKKESLQSIGLTTSNTAMSILLGIVGAIPFTYQIILDFILHKKEIQLEGANLWLELLILFIFTALPEELMFRGYIQTRITGLIKNKYLAIVVVGLLFALMHIPFQMSMVNMTFMDYLITNWVYMIQLMVMHIYFVYLYTRNNNILVPIISHTLIDFIQLYMK
ncbi:lysostaphin resistance A-like protein [Paenibacillus sp. RS8]|uniref:CPBP family intramembrane glutamic endopeptidase n=1 Tax=Paenibacillus sp. RS8 TaxID=3242681 RepID=UPI0035BFDCF8